MPQKSKACPNVLHVLRATLLLRLGRLCAQNALLDHLVLQARQRARYAQWDIVRKVRQAHHVKNVGLVPMQNPQEVLFAKFVLQDMYLAQQHQFVSHVTPVTLLKKEVSLIVPLVPQDFFHPLLDLQHVPSALLEHLVTMLEQFNALLASLVSLPNWLVLLQLTHASNVLLVCLPVTMRVPLVPLAKPVPTH